MPVTTWNLRSIPSHLLYLVVSVFFLAACGGGGGSERPADGDRGLMAEAGGYFIRVSESSIDLTFYRSEEGFTEPHEQIITVSFNGDGVIAGYAPGVAEPAWLTVEEGAQGHQSVDLHLQVDLESLSIGNYRTSLRLLSGDLETETPVFVDLPINVNIVAAPNFYDGNIVFAPNTATEVKGQTKTVRLDTSDAPSGALGASVKNVNTAQEDWLNASLNGSQLTVTVSKLLPVGVYEAEIELSVQGLGASSIPVRVEVIADQAELNYAYPLVFAPGETTPIYLSGTGLNFIDPSSISIAGTSITDIHLEGQSSIRIEHSGFSAPGNYVINVDGLPSQHQIAVKTTLAVNPLEIIDLSTLVDNYSGSQGVIYDELSNDIFAVVKTQVATSNFDEEEACTLVRLSRNASGVWSQMASHALSNACSFQLMPDGESIVYVDQGTTETNYEHYLTFITKQSFEPIKRVSFLKHIPGLKPEMWEYWGSVWFALNNGELYMVVSEEIEIPYASNTTYRGKALIYNTANDTFKRTDIPHYITLAAMNKSRNSVVFLPNRTEFFTQHRGFYHADTGRFDIAETEEWYPANYHAMCNDGAHFMNYRSLYNENFESVSEFVFDDILSAREYINADCSSLYLVSGFESTRDIEVIDVSGISPLKINRRLRLELDYLENANQSLDRIMEINYISADESLVILRTGHEIVIAKPFVPEYRPYQLQLKTDEPSQFEQAEVKVNIFARHKADRFKSFRAPSSMASITQFPAELTLSWPDDNQMMKDNNLETLDDYEYYFRVYVDADRDGKICRGDYYQSIDFGNLDLISGIPSEPVSIDLLLFDFNGCDPF